MKILSAILLVIVQGLVTDSTIFTAAALTTEPNVITDSLADLSTDPAKPPKPDVTKDPRCFDGHGNPISRGPFKNEASCESYFVCVYGYLFTLQCPDGLAFDPIQKVCNFPIQIPGCEYLDGVDPSLSGYCINNDSTPINPPPPPTPKPGTCDTYYYCENGTMGEQICPPGLVFNTDKQECDYEIDSPECVTGTTLSTTALANVTTASNGKQSTTSRSVTTPSTSVVSQSPSTTTPITKDTSLSTTTNGFGPQTSSNVHYTTTKVQDLSTEGSIGTSTTTTLQPITTTSEVTHTQVTTTKNVGPEITATEIVATTDENSQSTSISTSQHFTTQNTATPSPTSKSVDPMVTTTVGVTPLTENLNPATTVIVQPKSTTSSNIVPLVTTTPCSVITKTIQTESTEGLETILPTDKVQYTTQEVAPSSTTEIRQSQSTTALGSLVTSTSSVLTSTIQTHSTRAPETILPTDKVQSSSKQAPTTTENVEAPVKTTTKDGPSQDIVTESLEDKTTSSANIELNLLKMFPLIVSLSVLINC